MDLQTLGATVQNLVTTGVWRQKIFAPLAYAPENGRNIWTSECQGPTGKIGWKRQIITKYKL